MEGHDTAACVLGKWNWIVWWPMVRPIFYKIASRARICLNVPFVSETPKPFCFCFLTILFYCLGTQCGIIAEANKMEKYGFCRHCQTGKYVHILKISYSNKLLFQQFMAMSIWPRLICSDTRSTTAKTLETLQTKSYYDLSQFPEPEYWELDKYVGKLLVGFLTHTCVCLCRYSVPQNINLLKKIQSLNANKNNAMLNPIKEENNNTKINKKEALTMRRRQQHLMAQSPCTLFNQKKKNI
jgi:hypothetical protein